MCYFVYEQNMDVLDGHTVRQDHKSPGSSGVGGGSGGYWRRPAQESSNELTNTLNLASLGVKLVPEGVHLRNSEHVSAQTAGSLRPKELVWGYSPIAGHHSHYKTDARSAAKLTDVRVENKAWDDYMRCYWLRRGAGLAALTERAPSEWSR